MASPLTSTTFTDLLDLRVRDVALGQYAKGESFIPKIYTVVESDRAYETYSEVTPGAKFDAFLGAVVYQGNDQGYDVTATHLEYAQGKQIQRKLWDDDQFGIIDELSRDLGDNAFKTHEDHAAEIYSGAFSASSSFFSHTEAVALCSASHTSPVSGVSTTTGFDNYDTAALSPTSLTANIIAMRQFKDAAGDLCDIQPDELVFPVNLEDRVTEILRTTKGLDDAEGNVNPHEGRLKPLCWYRLSDSNNWFIQNSTLRKKNALWFWRVRLELAKMEGFDNIIAKFRGYMRYSFLRRDWRWIMGSNVS